MPTTTQSARVSSAPLLDAVESVVAEQARIDVAKLRAVLAWAAENEVDDADYVADALAEPGLEVAGPGAPVVYEWAALDLAAVMGVSTDSGLRYLGHALELRHRLPRLHARVDAGEVPVWRAFRVAEHTVILSKVGAAFVDQALAPFAHDLSLAQIERTTAAAIARFDPEEAERRRQEAAERRQVDIRLNGLDVPINGTVEIAATLDVADAIDLEAAVQAGAQQLADLGSTETLDVRRSQALGEMARAQLALDLDTEPGAGRGVTLYAHLDATDAGVLDNTQTPVLIEQIKQWCATAGTKVAVRPVLDLNVEKSNDAYRPSPAVTEYVMLRDRHCVFPRCTRRRVDLDHIHPHESGGPTSTSNLAPLCRRHHRAKTHSRWRYRVLEPGHYEWTSPTGRTFTVDRRRRP
ncbi:HNH endonuclease signature motif containing protein [Nocardioides marinquilinus]|uniref:HNH endonuclease signature motif containing protein n=1 Tax=Nocardioides marinquilinus TaxID=1210400 RepID=A0ABP9PE40_9ACTN